jgi:hypothetical protein
MKLEENPISDVVDCLFNILVATLHTWGADIAQSVQQLATCWTA